MSDQHVGRHHGHELHHTREHLSHEEIAQQAAHETALRLLADSRHLHVPAGGGPFQAIKNELPNSGDRGPAALAHMINQETGKTTYTAGESLPIPTFPAADHRLTPRVKHDSNQAATYPYGTEVQHRLNGMLNDLLRKEGLKPEKL